MNRIISIELFENHQKVNFYTLRFKGEKTEIDKFFDCFPEGSEYDEDINIIIKWIDYIGKNGALMRYLRLESKFRDNIFAIPIETNNLRVYVIRISDEILILGNGGLKTSTTYNTDSHLNSIVELLQKIDRYFKSRIQSSKIHIYQKQIFGDTTFFIEE